MAADCIPTPSHLQILLPVPTRRGLWGTVVMVASEHDAQLGVFEQSSRALLRMLGLHPPHTHTPSQKKKRKRNAYLFHGDVGSGALWWWLRPSTTRASVCLSGAAARYCGCCPYCWEPRQAMTRCLHPRCARGWAHVLPVRHANGSCGQSGRSTLTRASPARAREKGTRLLWGR